MRRLWWVGTLFVVPSAVYLGCSDDPAATVSAPPDGGAPSQSDGSANNPADGSVFLDSAPACTDTTFDCSASDDAGVKAVPTHLRCTSLYNCWSNKTVAANHREYAPAFTLWSDGAEKTRWMVLPPNTQIETSNTSAGGIESTDGGTPDEWRFPIDTMVFKEFKLAGKRIETRRIWKATATEWIYSVWRWNADETDAVLTHEGGFVPNGAKPYEIPKTTACAQCHDGHHDKFLSLDAWSLAAGATGVTLAMLKQEGRLQGWDHATTFAVPQDETGKFDKAVGFYYANCGFCHKPGRPGTAGTGLELHLPVAEALRGLPDGGAGIVANVTPVYRSAVDIANSNPAGGLFPVTEYQRAKRKDAAHSVLPGRDSLRAEDGGLHPYQMPPILSRVPDPVGVEATKQWINALP